MGWIAGIGSLVGGLASAYSASKKPSSSNIAADNYNAYGERNAPVEGAITSRDNIFASLNDPAFQGRTAGASNDYVQALIQAATGPGLNSAKRYNGDVLQGKYLNSPQVDGYADQAYNSIIAQGQDQNARTRAMFANNGIGFSTGNQQAEQAGSAAAASRGALARSSIRANNYQSERQLQQGAVNNELSLNSATPTYLSQINSALYAPYGSQAAITTGLLGSPVSSPQSTNVQNPSLANGIASGVSSASGLYSLLRGIGKSSGSGDSGNVAGGSAYGDMVSSMNSAY